MPAANRRRFSRVDFVTEASLEVKGNRYPARLLNLSLQGCLLEVLELSGQTTGLKGVIYFTLSGSEITLCFKGLLAHRSGECLGYCFEQIDLESMIHLRALLEHNLGNSAQVEREVSLMIKY